MAVADTTVPTSSGSVENGNDSAFHGLIPYERQARWIVEALTLVRLASSWLDQCVTPGFFGGGFSVSATIARWSSLRGRPGFGAFARPAIPRSS